MYQRNYQGDILNDQRQLSQHASTSSLVQHPPRNWYSNIMLCKMLPSLTVLPCSLGLETAPQEVSLKALAV